MKIAYYHNSFGGGDKRASYDLAKGLLQRGHQVDVFTPFSSNEDRWPFKDLGVDVKSFAPESHPQGIHIRPHVLEKYVQLGQWLQYYRRVDRINRLIAQEIDAKDYDVVWIGKCRLTSTPYIVKYLKTPMVFYCQEPTRYGYEKEHHPDFFRAKDPASRLQKFYRRLCDFPDRLLKAYVVHVDKMNTKKTHYILANSNYMKGYIENVYGKEVFVSYLGYDSEIYEPLHVERENYVLSVGWLGPLKRHYLAIEALSRIPAAKRPRFVIVTCFQNHKGAAMYKSYAESLGVDLDIKFNIKDSELNDLYNRALAVMYVAQGEPFGLVAIEAMGCGTPVVAVREGGLQETVMDQKTGFLTDSKPEALAEAILKLQSDPEMYQSMSQAAYGHASGIWTIDAAVLRIEKHFYKAAGMGSQARRSLTKIQNKQAVAV